MRYKRRSLFRRALAFLLVFGMALCFVFGCAGCGGMGASAATMFLRKTEGTVAVADGEGADVAPAENLGLYSGYTVGTKAESFAWIDLDKVKLAKLDENGEIHIVKDGKNLSIDVNAGSLFFNVTEPLAADETMEIRASSMLVGIRGTCGWVEAPDAQHMNVYILEGRVECTAGESTAAVNAGEMAAMTADGEIAVQPFSVRDVPAFVAGELEADETLNRAVTEASGLDVTADPMKAYERVFAGIPGEIVLAEEIDFEADGSPELMVLYQKEDEYGPVVECRIYRSGAETINDQLTACSMSIRGRGRLSLAESGGRQYIMIYWNGSQQEANSMFKCENYSYYGSVAQSNGDSSLWGRVDEVGYSGRDDTPPGYGRCVPREDDAVGLRHGPSEASTAEEYAAVIAQYTEVRVLFEG